MDGLILKAIKLAIRAEDLKLEREAHYALQTTPEYHEAKAALGSPDSRAKFEALQQTPEWKAHKTIWERTARVEGLQPFEVRQLRAIVAQHSEGRA